MNFKIEPHLLAEILRVAREARIHVNESLQDDNSDDVSISLPVIEFFEASIKQHPEPEISKWFLSEIARIREDTSNVSPS